MVVALDLGGTKVAAAVVDSEGRVRARAKATVEKGRIAEQILGMVHQVAGGWQNIAAAGLIVPGIYDPATGNVWAPNLFGFQARPLARELRLPVPLVIDSDRAGCVLGEAWLGAARGLREVVFLAVGTGIGAGILANGKLIRGAGDIAGSVGWFALDPRRQPLYGQCGCWEAEAAGPALARRAGAPAEAVVEAARAGDPAALAALDETASWLAMGIANVISILNPEMVILGGGLMQAGDLLLEPIRRGVLEWAQPLAARQARIELSQLGEDAGLLGAARLALNHVG